MEYQKYPILILHAADIELKPGPSLLKLLKFSHLNIGSIGSKVPVLTIRPYGTR